jgi:hypothetical protein
MAGLSSRFKKKGYKLPKYMLEANGKSLFAHSVLSFEHYFKSELFLFIALDVFNTKSFIKEQCKELGIERYQIIMLDQSTRGQAETLYLGLQKANVNEDESLIIFNIDTFRPGFVYPSEFDDSDIDGYLETFIGSGSNWSNVLPVVDGSNKVKLTAEKQEISQYCCTGLYYWRRSSDFCLIFESYQSLSKTQGGEFYIAPMYNELISQGKDVRFTIIPDKDVIFCGVPDEYESFLKSAY